VRQIAKEIGLITADKKDSQGLCFIGKVRLPEFLQQKLEPKRGKVIEVPANAPLYQEQVLAGNTDLPDLTEMTKSVVYAENDGKVVGEHTGAHYFTIGQRKGLNIGGTPEPLFIIETDTKNNVIYTGQGENHPGLYKKGLLINSEDIHWVRPDLEILVGTSRDYLVRIRYRQPLENATLYREVNGLYIIFDNPQKAIAPGQFAAWYEGDELIGSGVIS
jgi:tRNA-specific 2-thiouridylase